MNAGTRTAGEAREERESQGGGFIPLFLAGDFAPSVEITNSLVQTLPEETSEGAAADARAARAAAALPCLFETTASGEKPPTPLPGPRCKQAQALTDNIKWMATTFGNERVGFLTLTLGDKDAGGRYRNLRERKEAQRRFHSLFTNEIAKRYQCGVTVTERHQNGGIHFHLVVVCMADIRGGIDFAACYPPKNAWGKPQYRPEYSTANPALRQEWAYWRRIAKLYGFGRHQLQPMKSNGEALGRYLGGYLQKDWVHRLPEDKGARCVRYFGHWATTGRVRRQRRLSPPFNARFGWLTPKARAWREMLKQVVLALRYKGTDISETNIKDIIGNKWAWRMGKLFEVVRFETDHVSDAATREAIAEHNTKVEVSWLSGGGTPGRCCWWYVVEVTLDHLRPSPEWERQVEELQLVKEAESQILLGQRELAERRRQEAEKHRLLSEVSELFEREADPF